MDGRVFRGERSLGTDGAGRGILSSRVLVIPFQPTSSIMSSSDVGKRKSCFAIAQNLCVEIPYLW